MRSAAVYCRNHQYLVHAESKTNSGVWIFSDPCLSVAATGNDRELGLALIAGLDGSRSPVPHPPTSAWKGMIGPLLRLAGVKSWNTFAKSAECVSLKEERGRITLTPMRNLGPDDGYEEDPAELLVLEQPTAEELGAATRRVMPSRAAR